MKGATLSKLGKRIGKMFVIFLVSFVLGVFWLIVGIAKAYYHFSKGWIHESSDPGAFTLVILVGAFFLCVAVYSLALMK